MPTLQNGEKKLKDLRESNIALVINLMRKFGICSRAELSKASGLVQSTITSIIDSLIKAGIVIETGSLVGGRGRRSIGIRLNTEKLIVLGIRVTRSSYTLAIIDIFGELKNLEKHSITKDLEDPSVFERILEDASFFLLKNDQKPVGVGMALPGPYLINEDTSLFLTNQGWKSFTFTKKFESRLHLPVFVEQDSNVGAMGEWWFGNSEIGQGTKVFVSTGDGVGAGIVVDGKIQRGALGAAGEIGHMSINFEGLQCQCGNKGCLELYCSEKAILKAAKCLSKPILDFESLVTEYRAGNSAVTEIVNRAAEMFGIGIANIAYLFNPGVVVVGGSYKKLGDSFLDQVNRTVRRHIYPLFYQNIGLQFSALEHDSCLIGIAAVVFDRLLKKPSFLLDH